jgi:DoxX-like family
MPHDTPSAAVSKKTLWTGYVMSALPVIALVMSGVMKLTKSATVVQGFAHFGYQEASIIPLGILEIACTVLYLVPQTSILGAILVTGYFGGATATTYRIGEGWAPTVILGILVWGGLFMRDPRLRALIPIRKA